MLDSGSSPSGGSAAQNVKRKGLPLPPSTKLAAAMKKRAAPLAKQALPKREATAPSLQQPPQPPPQQPPRKKKKRRREDVSARPTGDGSGAARAAAWSAPRRDLGSTATAPQPQPQSQPQSQQQSQPLKKKKKRSGGGGLQGVPVAVGHSAQAHGSGGGGGKACPSSRETQPSSSRELQSKPAKKGDAQARPEKKVAPAAAGKDGIDDILAMMGGSARRPEPEPEPEPAEEPAAPDTEAALPPLDSAHRVAGASAWSECPVSQQPMRSHAAPEAR